MCLRFVSRSLLTLCLVLAARPCVAGTLYENGPINGTVDAWTINFGFEINDSFTISTGNSTVTGMAFGVWLTPGDTLQSVEVSLFSDPFGGTTYFDGIVNVTQSACSLNQYGYDVCTETGNFAGPVLGNGTYWVALQNAVDSDGDPVYWDENDGIGCQSPGCPSQAKSSVLGSIPSEAFSILGNAGTGTTPEPGTLALVASGVLGIGGVLRRKMGKSK